MKVIKITFNPSKTHLTSQSMHLDEIRHFGATCTYTYFYIHILKKGDLTLSNFPKSCQWVIVHGNRPLADSLNVV